MSSKPSRTYGQFLRTICADAWPYSPTDRVWEEARYWQDKGVDLATQVGSPLTVTFLGRLAKNAHRVDPKGCLAPDRAAPFMHLARLTDGKALAPEHYDSWTPLMTSYAVRSHDPEFHQHLARAFLYKREKTHQAPTEKETWTWSSMLDIAATIDDTDLLKDLLAVAPPGVHPFRAMPYGGARTFAWLVEHYGQDILDNASAPLAGDPRAAGMGLHDYLSAQWDQSALPMVKMAKPWIAQAQMDRRLPQADASQAPRRPIRL